MNERYVQLLNLFPEANDGGRLDMQKLSMLLEESAPDIEAASESRRQLLHDLRNAMAVLVSITRVLKIRLGPENDAADLLSKVEENVFTIKRVLGELFSTPTKE